MSSFSFAVMSPLYLYLDQYSVGADDVDCSNLATQGVNDDSCGNMSDPCVIKEGLSYWVCLKQFPTLDCDSALYPMPHEECFNQTPYSYTPPPDMILLEISEQGSSYLKAKIAVLPHIASNKEIKIMYQRPGNQLVSATGYFKILDVYPAEHPCFAIDTLGCGPNVTANNDFLGNDFLADWFRITNRLHIYKYLTTGTDFANPNISMNENLTNFYMDVITGNLAAGYIHNHSGGPLVFNPLTTNINNSITPANLFALGPAYLNDVQIIQNTLKPIYVGSDASITGLKGLNISFPDGYLNITLIATFNNSLDVGNLNVEDELYVLEDNFDMAIGEHIQLVNGKFMGHLNLKKACDDRSNTIRPSSGGGVQITFAGGTLCDLGDPCEGADDCATNECLGGYCTTGGTHPP